MIKLNLEPRTLPEARTEIATADGHIKVLDGQIEAKDSMIKDLTPKAEKHDALSSELAAEKGKVTDLTAKVGTLETQAAADKSTISDLTAKLTASEGKQADFDTKVEKAASDKAIELVAAKGLGPLPVKSEQTKQPGAKVKEGEVTGRSRVAAAWSNVGGKN